MRILVLGAGHDEMRAGTQQHGKLFDRGIRDDGITPGGDDKDRLPDVRGIARIVKRPHGAKRRIDPGYGRAT